MRLCDGERVGVNDEPAEGETEGEGEALCEAVQELVREVGVKLAEAVQERERVQVREGDAAAVGVGVGDAVVDGERLMLGLCVGREGERERLEDCEQVAVVVGGDAVALHEAVVDAVRGTVSDCEAEEDRKGLMVRERVCVRLWLWVAVEAEVVRDAVTELALADAVPECVGVKDVRETLRTDGEGEGVVLRAALYVGESEAEREALDSDWERLLLGGDTVHVDAERLPDEVHVVDGPEVCVAVRVSVSVGESGDAVGVSVWVVAEAVPEICGDVLRDVVYEATEAEGDRVRVYEGEPLAVPVEVDVGVQDSVRLGVSDREHVAEVDRVRDAEEAALAVCEDETECVAVSDAVREPVRLWDGEWVLEAVNEADGDMVELRERVPVTDSVSVQVGLAEEDVERDMERQRVGDVRLGDAVELRDEEAVTVGPGVGEYEGVGVNRGEGLRLQLHEPVGYGEVEALGDALQDAEAVAVRLWEVVAVEWEAEGTETLREPVLEVWQVRECEAVGVMEAVEPDKEQAEAEEEGVVVEEAEPLVLGVAD